MLLAATRFAACARRSFLHLRVREWQDIHFQLRQTVKELGFQGQPRTGRFQDGALRAVDRSLSHIGNKDLEKPEFLGARNGRFHLSRPPVCSKNRPSG